jgi:uncharacterized protein (DUF736 family)
MCGGAWEKRDRHGNPFLSVRLTLPDGSETSVLLFPNKFKWNSQDGKPDFVVYQTVVEQSETVEEHPF